MNIDEVCEYIENNQDPVIAALLLRAIEKRGAELGMDDVRTLIPKDLLKKVMDLEKHLDREKI